MYTDSKTNLIIQLEQLCDTAMHTHANSAIHEYLHQYDISATDAHVILYIGEHEKTNATSIANALHITRSGISKITDRLVRKSLIQVQYAENSKKSLSYTLTPSGTELYQTYVTLHNQLHTKVHTALSHYTEEELTCIIHFLTEFAEIL